MYEHNLYARFNINDVSSSDPDLLNSNVDLHEQLNGHMDVEVFKPNKKLERIFAYTLKWTNKFIPLALLQEKIFKPSV